MADERWTEPARWMTLARLLVSPLGAALVLVAISLFWANATADGPVSGLGAAALVLAATLAALRGLPPRAAYLLPFVAFVAFCALSIVWSSDPSRSWHYANRTLVYLAFVFVGLYLWNQLEELALGLTVLLGALGAWSLAGQAFPGLHGGQNQAGRLVGPVGYWNALALLGCIALGLGLWLVRRWRVTGTLLVYGWLVAIALTGSRGGLGVALLVAAAWVVLAGDWVESVATLFAASIPAACVAAIAFRLDGVTGTLPSHAQQVSDGRTFGLVLVAGGLVAAALAFIPRPAPSRRLRRVAQGVVVLVAVACLAVGATHARPWWHQFTSSTEVSNTDRFSAASNHRWQWWTQAEKGWQRHIVVGTGAGSFAITNDHYRTSSIDVTIEPHDLPLQFLSETGLIGLLLFLGTSACLVIAAGRRRGAALALSLAFPAYFVHGLFDIGWDYAAVSAPVFLAAGAVAGRPFERSRPTWPRVLVAAGVAVVLCGSLATVWLGDRWSVDAGRGELILNDPQRAIELAKRARTANPLLVAPLLTQAQAEYQLGNTQAALDRYAQAIRLQPENAEPWYQAGLFNMEALHCNTTALNDFNRVTALEPTMVLGSHAYARAVKLVDSGHGYC